MSLTILWGSNPVASGEAKTLWLDTMVPTILTMEETVFDTTVTYGLLQLINKHLYIYLHCYHPREISLSFFYRGGSLQLAVPWQREIWHHTDHHRVSI